MPSRLRDRFSRWHRSCNTLFCAFIFVLILFIIVVFGLIQFLADTVQPIIEPKNKTSWDRTLRVSLEGKDGLLALPTVNNCTYHTCFYPYRCERTEQGHITIYVYPYLRYHNELNTELTVAPSREFLEILETIRESVYYTEDPKKACLFVPSIDLLNQDRLRSSLEVTASVLAALPGWNDGTNQLLFTMLPGTAVEYNTTLDVAHGRAIVAGGGFDTWTYRRTFDVSIPIYSPYAAQLIAQPPRSGPRRWLAVSAQTGLHEDFRRELTRSRLTAKKGETSLILLDACRQPMNHSERCDARGKQYHYPQILTDASFCLVVRRNRLGQMALSDCMAAGSIPVIIADGYILPFVNVIDWKRAAIVIDEADISKVSAILRNISTERVAEMRRQCLFLYTTYMSSMRAITLTTLAIINDRVFPYLAPKYSAWNDLPQRAGVDNPLFLPLIPSKSAGFTAVILTYDRLESLFKIIQHVSLAPSLNKVLVVWNNQLKAPPPAASWPKISKPLKVVQTRHNRLSNRFYPYDEIETECILALDDDILMLTIDELEFGYQVWREFTDRLVGFPSRLHLWDNNSSMWKYESEWTSEISMVLTGAAFYHKYYNYLYTNAMPGDIKTWVDEHMNCEDIAFNFLVSNITGKPPIKVTPRQKFRCSECLGGAAMLSADLGDHMVERSECISRFARIYGTMPLQTVEFRADPVLYKDSFLPPDFHWFRDVGSL